MALVFLFCLMIVSSLAFPNGGPIDACIREKPNQPNHGGISAQPEASNPFIVEASGNFYKPGDIITVNVFGPKKSFKGFFLQGRDGETGEWIGTFEKGADAKSYPECSAVTHTDNDPKEAATLIWHAPKDRRGSVFFVGTVLQSYRVFWSDVVADVRN